MFRSRLILSILALVAAGLLLVSTQPTQAALWSSNNIQLLIGNDFEGFASEEAGEDVEILTLEHASGWKYGDNFYFVDLINPTQSNAANVHSETYMEWYSFLSGGKIFGWDPGSHTGGWITDVELGYGLNRGVTIGVGSVTYNMVGIKLPLNLGSQSLGGKNRIDWNFAQVEYYPIKKRVEQGGDAGWQAVLVWNATLWLGPTKWEFSGFWDFLGPTDGEGFGGAGSPGEEFSMLTQPQFLLDVGYFWDNPNRFYAGIEYQYWTNKFHFDSNQGFVYPVGQEPEDNFPQFMVKWYL